MLGSLFYYNSKLDSIQNNIKSGNPSLIELYSLDQSKLENLSQIDENARIRKVRDLFLASYGDALKQEKLNKNYLIWLYLTDPTLTNNKPARFSGFSKTVFDWINSGGRLEKVEEIATEGFYSTNIQDYSLYYGIKVLQELSKQTGQRTNDLNTEELELASKVSQESEFLVICSPHLAPLFKNLNAITRDLSSSIEDNVEVIGDVLKNKENIKLVLIIASNYVEILQSANKKFVDVVISGIDLETIKEKSSTTFFDYIARKTLGMRI